MKKSIVAFALALAGLGSLHAEQLSAAQALARLQSASSAPHRTLGSRLQPVPAFTSESDGLKAFYVFNAEAEKGGYMIVAADDVAAPLLGYADEGAFDPDNIPANMAWWLGEYAREIKWAIDNAPAAGPAFAAPRAARANIAPLVTARWDQGDPYNQDCPTVNGTRCVTGCVATAMAQIMYYHQWPKNYGSGSITYSWNNTNLSMDFTQTKFDWSNMTDTYGNSSTSAQKAAVAKLMKACGYSTKMGYGTDASGTQSSLIAWALTEYFDYDKGIQYLSRNAFTQASWETMIYDELAAQRPVQYSGRTLGGEGHAFVCDGYNDGYFHINWGWGGAADGYFLTSSLDPSYQGIGGSQSNDAFVTDQYVIIGIQKNIGTAQRPAPCIKLNADLLPNKSEYQFTEIVSLGGMPGNGSYITFNGELDVKFVNKTGGEPAYLKALDIYDLGAGYYYSSEFTEHISAADIRSILGATEGDYTVSLAYKYNGGPWQDCVAGGDIISKLNMTLTSTGLVFSYSKNEPGLEISDAEAITPLYIYRDFSMKAKASVQSEYNSTLCLFFLDPGTNNVRGFGDDIHYTFAPGTQEFTYTSPIYRNSSYSTFPAGEYEMVFVNNRNYQVSERIPVTLQANPGEPTLSFSNLKIVSGATAPKDNIQFSGKLTCSSGYFFGNVRAYIFPETGGTALASLTSEAVGVGSGQSVDFVASGSFMDGSVGTRYAVIPYCNNKLYESNWTVFTLADAEVVDPGQPVTGDVNADMVVDATDVQLTASYIMGEAVEATFGPEQADLNGDGKVSGIDVASIISLMGQTITTPYSSPAASAALSIDNVEAVAGDEALVTVKAIAGKPIVGFQCDITLPQDVELVEGSITLAKPQGVTLDVATVNGKPRILAYSMEGRQNTYTGGALFTFKVKAATSGNRQIKLTDAELDAKGDDAPVMMVCDEAVCSFSVKEPEVEVTAVTLNHEALSLKVGDTAEVAATITPSNATNTTLTWTVSDTSVIQFESGIVTALAAGTCTITATSANGLSATCTVTVSLKEQSITWEQTFEGVTDGNEITLTATASSGLDVTYAITEGASLAQLSGSTLKVLQSGTIKVKAEQDGNGEYAAAEPVEKEITALSSLSQTAAEESSAYADGGCLVICAAGEAEVYTPTGRLVYCGHATRLPMAPGVYIVRIASRTFKVII